MATNEVYDLPVMAMLIKAEYLDGVLKQRQKQGATVETFLSAYWAKDKPSQEDVSLVNSTFDFLLEVEKVRLLKQLLDKMD